MVNIMLFMPVGVQSLMVYPPHRGFSLNITGCIIPVLYYLLGIPNTCSYPGRCKLHMGLFTPIPLVQLPLVDVGVTVRPFPIGCYCDIILGKHLPHFSSKLAQFTSLLGNVQL